ncbi:MAG TPA: methylated-DNA--[protein]-cysteine S-methyltransferase [Candidatus Dormibacteraeota bacterium]|jgi:methylated-DNA-[protein]-cysteine S-methyltransferase|nr:methylated-DNA--[protein]-cysteine S-methyltransferase [Candidatus Dormibacteraeota bacterium]
MAWLTVPSPVGDLVTVAEGTALRRLSFGGALPSGDPEPDHPVLRAVAEQLRAYFAGELTDFDLPLELRGSDFEMAVWAELRRIPYGEMCSYGDIARAVAGDVGQSRAVGVANHRNPIAIVVPCHRVIGADGSSVGYGGGLERKRFLLEHELNVRFERGLLPI